MQVVIVPDDVARSTITSRRKAAEDHFNRLRMNYPRIFVSHRHKDVPVVEALVSVIEAAFQIQTHDLRCTSVHPYPLRAGERTSDRLRLELHRAEGVLGIVTPDTKDSTYVLFELWAAWGRGGVTFPLLAFGASTGDVPAPIGDLRTLDLSDEAECHQLIEDLSDVTTLNRRGGMDPRLHSRFRNWPPFQRRRVTASRVHFACALTRCPIPVRRTDPFPSVLMRF